MRVNVFTATSYTGSASPMTYVYCAEYLTIFTTVAITIIGYVVATFNEQQYLGYRLRMCTALTL